jgi:hypothetical protein
LRHLVGALCAVAMLLAASCAAPATVASSSIASSTVPTAAANTAAATFSVPATFAAVCGTASDRIARTSTADATFLLNSPGRSPLKIASTGNAPIDAVIPGGYVCLLLGAGVPFPIFDGLIGPQMPGFVAEGTFPATAARPAPTSFTLPQACAFVRPPEVGADQTYWWVDCGAQLNRDARGTLGTALVQQGWTRCGPAAATEAFYKGTTRIVVVESSLAPGDYPRFSQRPGTGCS